MDHRSFPCFEVRFGMWRMTMNPTITRKIATAPATAPIAPPMIFHFLFDCFSSLMLIITSRLLVKIFEGEKVPLFVNFSDGVNVSLFVNFSVLKNQKTEKIDLI